MELSIIIVNYNVKHFLEQCLLSVEKAIEKIDAEIFVVDNNSVDGSVKLVKEKFPKVNLIENKENTGFSKANNQAINVSKGKYVLLLNPDTVVEEDTFSKCIELGFVNEGIYNDYIEVLILLDRKDEYRKIINEALIQFPNSKKIKNLKENYD